MEKFYRRSGDDPWVNPLVPNDSNPAKFGHLNTIVDAVTALQEEFIYLKVSLTADQIQTAFSYPIDIGLPPSGVGYYYRVLAFDCRLNFNTIPFTNTQLAIISTIGGGAQFYFTNLNEVGNFFTAGKEVPGVFNNLGENDTLIIVSEDDSAGGNSTVDCYITVQKVKL